MGDDVEGKVNAEDKEAVRATNRPITVDDENLILYSLLVFPPLILRSNRDNWSIINVTPCFCFVKSMASFQKSSTLIA